MTINFRCIHCKKPLAVPDAHAGKLAVCVWCQGNVQAPGPEVIGHDTSMDPYEMQTMVPVPCPGCSHMVPPNVNFCPKCGFQMVMGISRKKTKTSGRRVALPAHLRKDTPPGTPEPEGEKPKPGPKKRIGPTPRRPQPKKPAGPTRPEAPKKPFRGISRTHSPGRRKR